MAETETDPLVRLVLAELRCAYLRAKGAELEIEQVSDLLKAGAIGPAEALVTLERMGWAGLLAAEMQQFVMTAKPSGARDAG